MTAKSGSPLLNGDGAVHVQEKALGPRTNGTLPTSGLALNPGNHVNSNNAWQTQKKKKKNKRAAKSDTDAQALNTSGGETLPVDESLRKGG